MYVGDHVPPPPSLVELLVNRFIQWLNRYSVINWFIQCLNRYSVINRFIQWLNRYSVINRFNQWLNRYSEINRFIQWLNRYSEINWIQNAPRPTFINFRVRVKKLNRKRKKTCRRLQFINQSSSSFQARHLKYCFYWLI